MKYGFLFTRKCLEIRNSFINKIDVRTNFVRLLVLWLDIRRLEYETELR